MRNTAIEMAKRLLVDSIWKSANVEGLGTTFPNTAAILEHAKANVSAEEVFFIVNMKRAWYFTIDNIECPVNLAYLRELNKICGEQMFYGNGEIRTLPVRISGTNWVPPIPNSAVIMEDLENINKTKDPEDRALEQFCYVARTQMFIDGNKRVAQLIANKTLMENGVGILQIPVDKVALFEKNLVNFYETGNNHNLKEFLASDCVEHAPQMSLTDHDTDTGFRDSAGKPINAEDLDDMEK